MKTGKAPNGLPIVKVYEVVYVDVDVHGFTLDEKGELQPVYADDSEVDWNTQTPRVEKDGGISVIDIAGNVWSSKVCEWTEASSEDGEDK